MWKKLLELVQDVFVLRNKVQGHDKRLDDLSDSVQDLYKGAVDLSNRVLRLEIENQHLREQQATERENFRLQMEVLILRLQRGLPPQDQSSKDQQDN